MFPAVMNLHCHSSKCGNPFFFSNFLNFMAMLLFYQYLASFGCARFDIGDLLPITTTSPRVAPNFIGLSIEVGAVPRMIGISGNSSALATVLHHLYALTARPHAGPTLRLGGNSADESCWHTVAPAYSAKCSYSIQDADLDAYVTFANTTAAAANVSFIIDTNFGLSPDPHAVAVAHLSAVLAKPGLLEHVLSFEVGNEMDIYASHCMKTPSKPCHRNGSYTEAEYEMEFDAFVEAYVNAGLSPTRMIQGATYAETSHGEWGNHFHDYVSSRAETMRSVSLHQYATSTCSSAGKDVTAEELLGDAEILHHTSYISKYAGFANTAGVPFVIGEGNTASCGGQPGVSDSMAAALWSLDYLPRLSKGGAVRMNFHGGPGGSYPPIAFDSKTGSLEVRPLFYGLYLFSHLVANDSQWRNVSMSGTMPPGPTPAPVTPGTDPFCAHGISTSGSSTCCKAECGVCGGSTCGHEPGGATACCSGPITTANVSCDTHVAPCVMSHDHHQVIATSTVVAHAASTVSGTTKVVLVAKTDFAGAASAVVEVCGASSVLGALGSTAKIHVMSGTDGVKTDWQGMSLSGRTFANSTSGEWIGNEKLIEVVGTADPLGGGGVCFAVTLPRYSAVMLVATL